MGLPSFSEPSHLVKVLSGLQLGLNDFLRKPNRPSFSSLAPVNLLNGAVVILQIPKINKIADKLNNEGAVKHDSCLRVLESGVKEV